MSSGASTEPTVSVVLHVPRQRGESDLPRNSKETPRMISANSTSTSAR